MKNATTPNPFQAFFTRAAEELKDVLLAIRTAESAVQFELAVLDLERIAKELETKEWEEGGV